MKKALAIIAAATALTACAPEEPEPEAQPLPFGQDYVDQRPAGWTDTDAEEAATLCRSQLMEELTPTPVGIRHDPAFTDQVFGSPTNLVVGGSAIAHNPSLGEQRQVSYLCEVSDPLGAVPMVTVYALP